MGWRFQSRVGRCAAEAVRKIGEARKDLTHAALRSEADADLALLRSLSPVVESALDGLSRSSKGRALVLYLERGEKVEGLFERALPQGIELKTNSESFTVEMKEECGYCLPLQEGLGRIGNDRCKREHIHER
jgi:hypothetical protein